jgi:hypothetical protein
MTKTAATICVCLMLLLGVIPSFSAKAASLEADFRLELSSGGKEGNLKQGQPFEIRVTGHSVNDLFGVEFHLEYDPSILQLSENNGVTVNERFQLLVKETDTQHGRITMAMTRKSLPTGETEDLIVSTLQFQPVSTGTVTLKLVGVKAVDSSPQLIPSNMNFTLPVTVISNPIEPGGPVNPVEPVNPVKPGGSSTPSVPPVTIISNPIEPGGPVNSVEPGGPSTPSIPPVTPNVPFIDLIHTAYQHMTRTEIVEHGKALLEGLGDSKNMELKDPVLKKVKELVVYLSTIQAGLVEHRGNEIAYAFPNRDFTEHISSFLKTLEEYDQILKGIGIRSLSEEIGKQIFIETDDRVSPGEKVKLWLPSSDMKLLLLNDTALRIVISGATFIIPPGAWEAEEGIVGNEEQASLLLTVSRLQGDVTNLADGYTPIGSVYDEVNGERTQSVTHFKKRIQVQIALPSRVGTTIDLEKLGSYWFDEDQQQWNYVGGKIRQDNMIFTTDHFSRYRIMHYDKRFVDVDKDHWADNEIRILAAKHIVNGKDEDSFIPDGMVTRAEFAALLIRALGLEYQPVEGMFRDVGKDQWYAQTVETAARAGIVSGLGGGLFDPEGEITREQMTVMLVNALMTSSEAILPVVSDKELPFQDQAQISLWALDSVRIAYEWGIINGVAERAFAPQEHAQRAQAASILFRLLQHLS